MGLKPVNTLKLMLLFDIHHDYIYVDYVNDFLLFQFCIVAALIGMITIFKS